MLGREVVAPAELVYPRIGDAVQMDPGNYVAVLEESMKSAYEVARKNLKESQRTMKKDHDMRINLKSYAVGDAVYVLNTASKKGLAKKLTIQWNGPGLVVRRITPYLYKIQFRKATVTANHDRMKLCKEENLPAWLLKAKEESQQNISHGTPSEETELYCICQQPDDGGFMIQCDRCNEWFHGHCVNVTDVDAEDIDLYTCPPCEVGLGLTTQQ